MKIYLTDQTPKIKQHIDFLKNRKVMEYDISKLKEKTSTIEIETNKKLEELDLDFLFNYQIFPENIMSYKTQWSEEDRKMKVGDTIVQQVYLPPVKTFSQKLIFGVRIKDIIDQDNKKGFSYETLEGHVEKGISTFTIEQQENRIIFKIHTHSSPGTLFTKLVGPIFSVPYQAFCTKAALKNMKRQLERK